MEWGIPLSILAGAAGAILLQRVMNSLRGPIPEQLDRIAENQASFSAEQKRIGAELRKNTDTTSRIESRIDDIDARLRPIERVFRGGARIYPRPDSTD